MTNILTRRWPCKDTDVGDHYMMMKAELGVTQLQAKECQRFLANHQKLGRVKDLWIPYRCQGECGLAETLIQTFSSDCYTEWNKSEKEKQISYINAYMWNLEKWYRWTGLQSRNRHRCRDTDVEKHMEIKGGKRVDSGGMNWEIVIDIYTLLCIK